MFQPVEQPKNDLQSTPRSKIKNQTMRPHDWPFAWQDITFPEKALVSVSRHVIGLLLRARRAEKPNDGESRTFAATPPVIWKHCAFTGVRVLSDTAILS